MKSLLLTLFVAFASTGFVYANELPANEPEQTVEIPTSEKEFVETIKTVGKQQILEQLGEPSIRDDVMGPSGEVVASVWHYRYLNTDENGDYYKTTELDFLQDRVVMVVFMNHDVPDVVDQPGDLLEDAPDLLEEAPQVPFGAPPVPFSDTPYINI